MVETGVLELPLSDDDDFQYELITRRKTPPYEIVESFENGDKIDITEYPELRKYCNPKSIQSSVDYSKIPIGTELRCKDEVSGSVWIGHVKKVDGPCIEISFSYPFTSGNTKWIYTKSCTIEVIRWGGK
jgi:hypothetical protein